MVRNFTGRQPPAAASSDLLHDQTVDTDLLAAATQWLSFVGYQRLAISAHHGTLLMGKLCSGLPISLRKAFLELHSSLRQLLHNLQSPSPCTRVRPASLNGLSGLKALPSYACFLLPLFFTGFFHSKSLEYPILSWHSLGIRRLELTRPLIAKTMARAHFSS